MKTKTRKPALAILARTTDGTAEAEDFAPIVQPQPLPPQEVSSRLEAFFTTLHAIATRVVDEHSARVKHSAPAA